MDQGRLPDLRHEQEEKWRRQDRGHQRVMELGIGEIGKTERVDENRSSVRSRVPATVTNDTGPTEGFNKRKIILLTDCSQTVQKVGSSWGHIRMVEER